MNLVHRLQRQYRSFTFYMKHTHLYKITCVCGQLSVFTTWPLVSIDEGLKSFLRACFCTVRWWQSTCLNSAAKRLNRPKNTITRTHSHTAAPEGWSVWWRTDTEERERSRRATTGSKIQWDSLSYINLSINCPPLWFSRHTHRKDTDDDQDGAEDAAGRSGRPHPASVLRGLRPVGEKQLHPEVAQANEESQEGSQKVNSH